MRCEDCKYFDNKQKFENTTLGTCKVALYLLKKLKEQFKNSNKTKAYLTTALTSEEETCMFEYRLLTFYD